MADQIPHLEAFVKLGNLFQNFCDNDTSKEENWHHRLTETVIVAGNHNGWFTKENVLFALKSWAKVLTSDRLTTWLNIYNIPAEHPKRVAIIMAGNIPLVGLHDFISVVLSGHQVIAKLSSNDRVLMHFIVAYLKENDDLLSQKITLTEDKLGDFDAVIATGSNNTGRYFDYYFGKYPNIIRKNRNSVAVLSGTEGADDLQKLGTDIFTYFGLGCRSVSKIYVPKDYNFDHFYQGIYSFKTVIDHHKYANNYDYNKAVYLMSDIQILDNNFLLLKEDKGFASPIGCLFYETYETVEELNSMLQKEKEALQCVLSNLEITNALPFGISQKPSLDDYADGVDTLKFLSTL